MEVLEFLDNSGTTIVKRTPENGDCEVKWGAQLTVRESQEAVFFRDGNVVEVFGSGRHVLDTKNVPLIGKWVTSFAYGPKSPFRAEVYFVGKQLFPNMKWGTKEPILFRDTVLKMVSVRANGAFSIQVADSKLFVNKIVGTMGAVDTARIEDYLRSMILSQLNTVLGQEFTSVFDIPSSFEKLNAAIKEKLGADFAAVGLSLHDFFVNSFSVPDEVQAQINTGTGINALGNMDEFMKYKMAMAMDDVANNPNSTAGSMMGMGTGIGMGYMMPSVMQSATGPAMASFANTGQQQMAQQMGQQTAQPASESPIEKLKKLKELLDMGILTQAEFDDKKKKLLELL